MRIVVADSGCLRLLRVCRGARHVCKHGSHGVPPRNHRPAPLRRRHGARPVAHLRPVGGGRPVGHPGRRRQGQGAAGRRRATSSASAPASRTSPRPAHIVEAAVGRLPRPRQPPLHARRPGSPELREAIAAKTARDSGYEVAAVPGARHQRRQAGRLRGVRHPGATPATRCSCRRPTGPPTPRPSPWPAACRSPSPPTRPPAST